MTFVKIAGLLVVALGLISLEPVIPSFGLLSVLGLTLGAAAVYTAFSLDSAAGWATLAAGVAGMPLAYYLGFRLMRRSPLVHRDRMGTGAPARLPQPPPPVPGTRGTARTRLRPMGMAQFADRTIEVAAQAGVIEPGTPVEVVEVQRRRVLVRPARDEEG